nr:hypothetical protein [Armatimonas sp.]
MSATEATLFLQNANQSPFNVGQQIPVTDFNIEEARELNLRFWRDTPP